MDCSSGEGHDTSVKRRVDCFHTVLLFGGKFEPLYYNKIGTTHSNDLSF